jgi:ABC-type dipeptide/oligopeptide/nickel transport system ATPase component
MDTAGAEVSRLYTASPNFGIEGVYVEKLFGQFKYDLGLQNGESGKASKLWILYGDNGSGKTTILSILFNLLSHMDKRGHKTAVSKKRFKRFVVSLTGGVEVSAERTSDHDRPFRALFKRHGQVVAEAIYGLSKESTGDREEAHQDHTAFLAALASLGLKLLFLPDDRKVATNVPGPPEEEDEVLTTAAHWAVRDFERMRMEAAGKRLGGLEHAIERLRGWATQLALHGSSQGEEDVNSIYAQIVSRLAAGSRQQAEPVPEVAELRADLQAQAKRSIEFARFGLSPVLNVEPIISTLGSVPAESLSVIARVLGPYVGGITARLDALEDVRKLFSALVDTINSFLRNKAVRLDVRRGLRITSNDGDELPAHVLSSGEKQLLFLFSNTVVATERPSIFIIDEPELSLNVEWQRHLLTSLLELTRGSRIQFFLATHSIELLTRHRSFVVPLESLG